MYYVYIIYSKTRDEFYKRQTNNLEDRLKRHNEGRHKYIKGGGEWVLVWSTAKPSRSAAVKLENILKQFSRKRLQEFVDQYEVNKTDLPKYRTKLISSNVRGLISREV